MARRTSARQIEDGFVRRIQALPEPTRRLLLAVASIEAHLSIVVAALAVSHRVDHQTSWSMKKFVRTARRYRTVKIKAGKQMLTRRSAPRVRTSLSQVRTVGAQRNPSRRKSDQGVV